MELVSSQSDADIRKAQAEEDVVFFLRAHASNLLRVIRGAGKGYSIGSDMAECIAAFEHYRDAHGCYPSDYVVATALNPEKASSRRRARDVVRDEEDRKRWYADGTFAKEDATDRIVRGALQLTASLLADQPLQQAAGERELSDGVQLYEEAREQMREYHNPMPKAKSRR